VLGRGGVGHGEKRLIEGSGFQERGRSVLCRETGGNPSPAQTGIGISFRSAEAESIAGIVDPDVEGNHVVLFVGEDVVFVALNSRSAISARRISGNST
jgi:hypothetical protein